MYNKLLLTYLLTYLVTTRSRINVLTAHAQFADIIITAVAENGVAHPK